ncbi:peroxidase-like [Anthonomus grandis grandis]|uniref:peroxidase-like n=1 Tax=Anthonomus grandis grandis TaxID=2921223 RepID=UPI002166B930|nr:peroxidase-like [Anthonomus grandis grandis]
MTLQKILSLVFLATVTYAKPQSYHQDLFLQRISPSPQGSGTIYGGTIIDNHLYNQAPGRNSIPISSSPGFSTQPQVAAPIQFNGGYSGGFGGGSGFQFSQSYNPVPQPQAVQDPATLGCGQPPAFCPKTRYRSYDGSCNNLRNPGLGIPQTTYNRLLPAKYGDGISTPTAAKSGNALPSARTVSVTVYPDVPIEDPIWTLNAMQYGQIITHDMSMIVGSTQTQPHSTRCCSPDGQLLELANSPDHCFPIVVPIDDPVYSQQNTRCMNFVRTITDKDRRCIGDHQPAEQLTAVNHYLDLSIVYGNSDQVNQQVRAFQGGRLISEQRNNQEWLPRNQNASGVCTLLDPNEPCYAAGDVRVNQNPQLTLLQTLLLREHNRIADTLQKLNPHWDDETTFQEARKINIAQHQHISYYEWLPIFIGTENSLKNRILYKTKDYVNDYDPSVNPTILNEHATAAFRFFHTLIAGQLDLVSEHRNSYGNIRISDWFNRPAILEQGNSFDELTRGLGTQPELAADFYHTREITQNWLRQPGQQVGQDLKAICIQRNRDHGLASYNDYRHFCGLPKAHSFQDFSDVISKDNVERLASLYEHPDDVDLTVGGSLEAIVPGTLAGPTFLCILTEQFFRTRVGDRFWYENSGEIGFTLPQLNELRKASISRIMCDNTANVRAMQPRGFERISHTNAVVPCEALPVVDLSLWKDLNGGGVAAHLPSTGFADDSSLYFKK